MGNTPENIQTIIEDTSEGTSSISQNRTEQPEQSGCAKCAELQRINADLLEACQEFVRKCENGEAKSTHSYAQMKAAIAKATTPAD